MSSNDIKVKTSQFKNALFGIDRKYEQFILILDNQLPDFNTYSLKQFLNQLRTITDIIVEINQLSSIENMSSVYVLIDQLDLAEKFIISESHNPALFRHLQEINSWYKIELNEISIQIKKIRNDHNNHLRREITKQLIQEKSDVLFHGVKHQYAKEILTRQSILGYTHQRYWENGKRHNEDDPEFESSFRMKGISMSRDLEYALNWADVLLVFDRNKIKQRHKIEPYAWSFHFSKSISSTMNKSTPSTKKEREDYVVLSKNKKTYKNQDNEEWMKEYEEIMTHSFDNMTEEEIEDFKKFQEKMTKEKDNMHLQDLTTPEGEFDFSKNDALVGIALKQSFVDIYGPDHELVQFLTKHPLFLGIIE